ncbi:hypothetical protein OOT46_27925 [Aquabacterium sp. A7-Y]|uniref:hypothetical protein n=1 Tax=Aquabacterium sp. A7-Y TaxID=1349605 RepID=UPI00223E297C|nr:hypothetical protein [Aquabacterium sp. A7-Y]MCW7541634.1 hypothetical protein [Aquabacterium sp. A7-Y]
MNSKPTAPLPTAAQPKPSPAEALVQGLQSIAIYNDKGHAWVGHGPDEIARMREGFQQALLARVAELGEQRLSPELLEAIRSGAAAQDGSGRFHQLAQRELGGAAARAALLDQDAQG